MTGAVAKVTRRAVLAASAWLAAPSLAYARRDRVLEFVPSGDLAVLDPVLTPTYVTRYHGFLVFDTLYGVNSSGRPQPQMAAGHSVEDGYKTWVLALRDGHPNLNTLSEVSGNLFRRMGFNFAYQATHWGTIVQRRPGQESPDRGGGSSFCNYMAGYDAQAPTTNTVLNAVARTGDIGWFDSPRLAGLRSGWLDTADAADKQRVAREIQMQFLQDVPLVPVGQLRLPTAYRSPFQGVSKSAMIMFHNVSKAS